MKQIFTLVTILLFCVQAKAQTCASLSVQLTATVQTSPAKITLKWKRLGDTTTYSIYKKYKTSLTWGFPIATLTTNDSQYTDAAVIVDSAYEYQVKAPYRNGGSTWPAIGYIYAAVKAPAIHSRGGIVVMVDSTFTDSCRYELHRLMKDLSGDGWQVLRHDVGRNLPDTSVKRFLINDYNSVAGVKAVLLLGHVAVPYSGDQNPDGHGDHKGAWPADLYYAHLRAVWTDTGVNDTSAGYAANQNRPHDGKWDAIGYTSFSELQVSRVDFYDMPSFSASEVQMMRNYLNKAHIFKMDSLSIRKRALIDDNFGVFTVPYMGVNYYEAFASSGWRNFTPMVGVDSISTTDFITSLDTGSYLWAYGCGGGSFASAGGIGSTSDFANHRVQGIFTMMFGSYFGDWNVRDNFLRAPLCSPDPALTSCWSGRPLWYFHQMALGDHIGYCGWQSQNNNGSLYSAFAIGYQYVTQALLGDLSLRNDYVKPARALNVTRRGSRGADLAWTASPDASVLGYYVYRCDTNEFGSYTRVSGLITGTTFSDTVGRSGLKYYMVRPVKLQATPSGNYYNLGLGITDSGTITFPPTTSVALSTNELKWNVYPNPASNYLNITIDAPLGYTMTIKLFGINGNCVATSQKQLQPGNNQLRIDVATLPAGTYLVQATGNGATFTRTITKL